MLNIQLSQAKIAITKKKSTVLDVKSIVGIPDYETLFTDFNAGDADGLMAAQEFRLALNSTTEEVQLHYRNDCTMDGWLPRPVLPTTELSSTWKDKFVCSDPTQGAPVSFTHYPLTGERGNRQAWMYDVMFARGMTEEFILPCPSIPVSLVKATLVEGLKELPRQKFSAKGMKQLANGKDNVYKLLQMKGHWPTYGFVWEQFFNALPQSDDDERFPVIAKNVALKDLVKLFQKDVQV